MLVILFCGIALALYGVYSHGQHDVLSLCASQGNSMYSTKSVRCFLTQHLPIKHATW